MTAVSDTPLWLAAPARSRHAPELPQRTRACVIGAGAGGLATALALAEAGVDVVVLEARGVGSGASGRNGGFMGVGGAEAHHEARRRWGPDAALRIHALTASTLEQICALADRAGAAGAVVRCGTLRVASDHAEAVDIRAEAAALAADGLPCELVAWSDLPAPYRREDRIGLLAPEDARTQPGDWIRALAALAERAGARILESTRVLAPPTEAAGGVRVETDRGAIACDQVVIAADAALPALAPALAARVRARRLHILATEPVATTVFPVPVHTRWSHEYMQQTAEGRIVLGGFSDLDGAASFTDRETAAPAIHARIERYLREELGIAAAVTHRWVGVVGYSGDSRPLAGPLPGSERTWVLGGYSGSGNVLTVACGGIVAAQMLGGSPADADLFAPGRRLDAPRFSAGF